MYYKNIAQLAQSCPELTVNVKLGELIEAVEHCVNSTRSNLEEIIQDEAQEKYLTPKKTAEMLDCNLSTLWRHDKKGYLKPVHFGAKKRYKLSEIKKIMED